MARERRARDAGSRSIAARRNTKEARLSAGAFAEIIERAPGGVYTVDAELRLQQVNSVARPVFASVRPLMGRDIAEVLAVLWGPEVGQRCADILRHTLATGERHVARGFVALRRDIGVRQAYEWESQRITLPGGRHGVVCHFQDVTERELVVAALRASEELSRSVLESSPDCVKLLGADGRLLTMNANGLRLMEIDDFDSIRGKEWLVLWPRETWALVTTAIAAANGGHMGRFQAFRPTAKGTPKWWDVIVAPVRDGRGTITGLVTVSRDVTEQKRVVQVLADQDRRKDEFLATLAHELRNPLAPIRSGLEVVRRARSPEEADRTFSMMDRQIGQLVHLVDDLLDVSRVRSGKVTLRTERLTIRDTVDMAVEACRPIIDAMGHALHVDIPAEPLAVSGDKTRLVQVLTNLLTNAAKYSERGGRIQVAAAREGGAVVVQVVDSGIGIPNHLLPTLWDMFTQVRDTLDKAQGGLGIGLSLARRLIEMHGGSIVAESAGAGRGSTFTVRLPLVEMPDPASAGSLEHEMEQPASLPCRRVLVVDDNVDGADSLAMVLQISGHQTKVAYSGTEALEAVLSFVPELVFLDIGLPGMDGYEVARRFRADPRLATTTLVALTGWGSAEDKRKSLEAGFDVHLTKPVEMAAVKDVLGKLGTPAVTA